MSKSKVVICKADSEKLRRPRNHIPSHKDPWCLHPHISCFPPPSSLWSHFLSPLGSLIWHPRFRTDQNLRISLRSIPDANTHLLVDSQKNISSGKPPAREMVCIPPNILESHASLLISLSFNKTLVRAPCPVMNTLANHDFVPHDGRNITMPVFVQACLDAFNISAAFCIDAFGTGVAASNPVPNSTVSSAHSVTSHPALPCCGGTISRFPN